MNKILLSILALFLFSATALAENVEIQFQTPYPPTHVAEEQFLVPWQKSISDKSKGELVIHEFAPGSIVNALEVNQAIINGMLDMTLWSPAAVPKLAPTWQIANLPFLGENAQHTTEIYWKMYEKYPELKKEVDKLATQLLISSSTMYGFASTKGQITKPSDLVGKRVMATLPSDLDLIRSWGGVPVRVSPTDVYMGLQRGMGEVFMSPIPMLLSLKLPEIAKFITVVPMTGSLTFLSVNTDLYASLSKEHQTILMDGMGKEGSLRFAKILDDDAKITIQKFKDTGANVVILDGEQLINFKSSLNTYISGELVNIYKNNGLQNSEEWVRKAYEIGASVPAIKIFN